MPADLPKIRALLASLVGFTEGPWRIAHSASRGGVDSCKVYTDALGEHPVCIGEVNGFRYLPADQRLFASAPDLHRHASNLADEVERLRAEVATLRAGQDEAVAAAAAKERADVVAFLLARQACRAAERDEACSEAHYSRLRGAAAELADAAEEVEAGNHARPNGGAS